MSEGVELFFTGTVDSVKGGRGQRVKASPHAVDVNEGERVSVSAIGQKHEDPLAGGIDPATGPRKTEMAETVGGERRAGGRILRRRQLPTE